MRIGPYSLENVLIAAPMAGVTDPPFRRLCSRLGAALAIAEMVSADPRLRETRKSRLRLAHDNDEEPRAVQIAGADPSWLADAARYNVERGAQIIDINMGCPAKKVCNTLAGSALLGDERLVGRILATVVAAVSVPVTVKIRTGLDPNRRNGIRIAKIAESSGIAAVAVHGRTRACAFKGAVDYETIARIKQAVGIPVIANGDIDSPRHARWVLERTGADGLMIGRGAQGNPWIFREINHYLRTGRHLPPPSRWEVAAVLGSHLRSLHRFYGEGSGVRIARKHLSWYCKARAGAQVFWSRVNRVTSSKEQIRLTGEFFGEAAPCLEVAA